MRFLTTFIFIVISIMTFSSYAVSNSDKFKEAQTLMSQKDYAKALPILIEVVSVDQKNADAFAYLGNIYQQMGKNDDAVKYYEMAINVDKKHKGANQHLGELYLIRGDLPKAQERLMILEKTCPKNCLETKILKEKVDGFSKAGNQTYQINEMN